MYLLQWMRAELEYFCLAAYEGSQSVVAQETKQATGHDEEDFIDRFAEVSFYDRSNPVREWMEYGRSNLPPVLDEDSDEVDVPLPSHLVRYIIFIYIQMCVYVSPCIM
jgi:hypothetical protein